MGGLFSQFKFIMVKVVFKQTEEYTQTGQMHMQLQAAAGCST